VYTSVHKEIAQLMVRKRNKEDGRSKGIDREYGTVSTVLYTTRFVYFHLHLKSLTKGGAKELDLGVCISDCISDQTFPRGSPRTMLVLICHLPAFPHATVSRTYFCGNNVAYEVLTMMKPGW
jgi:hypothetical protein